MTWLLFAAAVWAAVAGAYTLYAFARTFAGDGRRVGKRAHLQPW